MRNKKVEINNYDDAPIERKSEYANGFLSTMTAIGFGILMAVFTWLSTFSLGKPQMPILSVVIFGHLFSAVFVVMNMVCAVYHVNTKKNFVVIYFSILLTALAALLCTRILDLVFVPMAFASVLVVMLVNKRSAFITNIACFAIVLVMYSVYWYCRPPEFSYAKMIYLAIKFVASCAIIAFYRPTFNHISIIGEVCLTGILSGISAATIGWVITSSDVVTSLMNGLWMLVSDAASLLLCLLVSAVIEWVFGLETNLKILEYTSFDQPLLKEMSKVASGTFHHSLAVGNLAERCANAIGENVNLAKAAAYFHDVGKMTAPEYFTENQKDGMRNPHDDLTYEHSVRIITRHTEIGYKMLTKDRFPKIIADVALEHHGDGTVGYFYIQAMNITEGEVDSSTYRYAGPRPSTRIAAIVMIADTVEAATRSRQMFDRQELDKFIGTLIKDKREAGQFDNCDITMRELAIIRATLVEALVGTHHQRISYPTKKGNK